MISILVEVSSSSLPQLPEKLVHQCRYCGQGTGQLPAQQVYRCQFAQGHAVTLSDGYHYSIYK